MKIIMFQCFYVILNLTEMAYVATGNAIISILHNAPSDMMYIVSHVNILKIILVAVLEVFGTLFFNKNKNFILAYHISKINSIVVK